MSLSIMMNCIKKFICLSLNALGPRPIHKAFVRPWRDGNEPTLYYITYTCYNWLYLFSLTNGFDLVYKWFDYLKDSTQIKTTAFIIMPNHVHAILFFPTDNYNLNTIISNAKRFTAYEIVNRLKQSNEKNALHQLEAGLSKREKKKG